MRVINIYFACAVLCIQVTNIFATPIFNFAVKTKSGEEGHKVSFVYPKDSYDLSFNLKTMKINSNSFDFAGLISSFTKGFGSFFSSFSGLSNLSSFSNPLRPATTTVEPFDDFGKDEDGSSWNNDGDSSSTTEESSELSPEEINSDFDSGVSPDSSDFDVRTGDDSSRGYEYPKQTTKAVAQETIKPSYLPPVTSMRPPLLPTTKKPNNIYLPSF